MAGLVKVPRKRNPYSNVNNVILTVGTESANTINVAAVVKGTLARTALRCWLSKDSAGVTPANNTTMPTGGYAVGTNGVIQEGPLSKNRLMVAATLAIDAVPEKFKLITTTAAYFVNGNALTKAPATAIVFSAAHVVSASKFGVILVQVDASGTVTTKVPLATQAYTSAALALAALPEPDAGKVALGYIAIAAGVAAWTANTDDMTNGNDLTTAAFNSAVANGMYPTTFTVVTTAAGLFDVTISEAGVKTMYLNVQLPSGEIVTSSAITFA